MNLSVKVNFNIPYHSIDQIRALMKNIEFYQVDLVYQKNLRRKQHLYHFIH